MIARATLESRPPQCLWPPMISLQKTLIQTRNHTQRSNGMHIRHKTYCQHLDDEPNLDPVHEHLRQHASACIHLPCEAKVHTPHHLFNCRTYK